MLLKIDLRLHEVDLDPGIDAHRQHNFYQSISQFLFFLYEITQPERISLYMNFVSIQSQRNKC